jgi:hypothetical protein
MLLEAADGVAHGGLEHRSSPAAQTFQYLRTVSDEVRPCGLARMDAGSYGDPSGAP